MEYNRKNLQLAVAREKKLARMGIIHIGPTLNALSAGGVEQYFREKGYVPMNEKDVPEIK